MNFATDIKFIENFIGLAIKWMIVYHNFGYADAKREVDMIVERIGLEKFVESAKAGDLRFHNPAYIRMSRVGAKIALDRRKRIDIALTLNSVINHASINAGYH